MNLQFSLFKRVTYILDKFYEAFQTRWFSESKCLHRHYLVDHSLGITYYLLLVFIKAHFDEKYNVLTILDKVECIERIHILTIYQNLVSNLHGNILSQMKCVI